MKLNELYEQNLDQGYGGDDEDVSKVINDLIDSQYFNELRSYDHMKLAAIAILDQADVPPNTQQQIRKMIGL